MVIAAGTLHNAEKWDNYNKKVQELEQILKEAGVEENEKIKSLASKADKWQCLTSLGCLTLGSSFAVTPLLATTYGMLPGIAYFMGSLFALQIGNAMHEDYAFEFLHELEIQAQPYRAKNDQNQAI